VVFLSKIDGINRLFNEKASSVIPLEVPGRWRIGTNPAGGAGGSGFSHAVKRRERSLINQELIGGKAGRPNT
jgi:hypothetical protein